VQIRSNNHLNESPAYNIIDSNDCLNETGGLLMNNEICEVNCQSDVGVDLVKNKFNQVDFYETSLLFKAMSDENRLKIVYALTQSEELCVCDIAIIIECSVATTSHHLQRLLASKIVKFRKHKKLALYSLDDNHIQQLMSLVLIHLNEVRTND
jgi:DNA-binding transcriptional ArsR family regulator